MNKLLRSQSGQTLIEIIIATGVVVMVLTAIAAGLTYSIKNTAQSKYIAEGTAQAQQVIETLRRERTLLGWQAFTEALPAGRYCFDTLPEPGTLATVIPTNSACPGSVVAGTEFVRQAEVTPVGGKWRVEVRVAWYDGAQTKTVSVVQEFQEY